MAQRAEEGIDDHWFIVDCSRERERVDVQCIESVPFEKRGLKADLRKAYKYISGLDSSQTETFVIA